MSEPFVGEIRMFAGNFAPRGWAFCDGQLMSIPSNDALFSLLGTIYGGDGRSTFGLPDLRGRLALHQGSGPGLSTRALGSRVGNERETLLASQIPSHTHVMRGASAAAASRDPAGKLLGTSASTMYVEQDPDGDMLAGGVQATGGSQAHDNMMPFLCIHFIISLFGIYPSRT